MERGRMVWRIFRRRQRRRRADWLRQLQSWPPLPRPALRVPSHTLPAAAPSRSRDAAAAARAADERAPVHSGEATTAGDWSAGAMTSYDEVRIRTRDPMNRKWTVNWRRRRWHRRGTTGDGRTAIGDATGNRVRFSVWIRPKRHCYRRRRCRLTDQHQSGSTAHENYKFPHTTLIKKYIYIYSYDVFGFSRRRLLLHCTVYAHSGAEKKKSNQASQFTQVKMKDCFHFCRSVYTDFIWIRQR